MTPSGAEACIRTLACFLLVNGLQGHLPSWKFSFCVNKGRQFFMVVENSSTMNIEQRFLEGSLRNQLGEQSFPREPGGASVVSRGNLEE